MMIEVSEQGGRPMVDLLVPKNDAVFKMLLTYEGNEDVLIHLLSAVLLPSVPITSAKIKNPEIPKKHIGDKGTMLDILAELSDGRQLNLEMQMNWRPFIPQRAFFYASRLIAGQLKRSEHYEKLRPVIIIFLLGEIGFRDAAAKHFHYVFNMREDQNLAQITSMMSLHFIEIPKLIKCLNTGIALTENFALTEWCKFLYNPASPVKDEVFASMPPLKKARKTLESISANEAAREIARQREKGFRDYISDIHYARETGKAEGKAEGIAVGKAEGIAVGKAEGEAKGKNEERLRMLAQLLSNHRTATMPAEELASLCGLSVDEVMRALSNIQA